MGRESHCKITGSVRLELLDEKGRVIHTHNTVVYDGRDLIINFLGSPSNPPAPPTRMAIGCGLFDAEGSLLGEASGESFDDTHLNSVICYADLDAADVVLPSALGQTSTAYNMYLAPFSKAPLKVYAAVGGPYVEYERLFTRRQANVPDAATVHAYILEAGLFYRTTAGVYKLFSRAIFTETPALVKDITNQLRITWRINA